jgi:predicted O-methyltransferase YrrM
VTDDEVPPGIDASVATAARMYDYWLGGHNNFAADRIAALEIGKRMPEAPHGARENRKFLGRAVRYLAAEAGIRQFLDLGTGLPTGGSVHQVAQAIAPDARVVYVDNDPMVLAHARALKTGDHAAVIHADLRDTDAILGHPDTRRLIDFSEPVAVMFVSVLHFVPGPDAHQAVARYLSVAAPGSYLVLSHVNAEPDPEVAAKGTAVYASTANPITARSRDEILGFFGGLDLLEPGLVPVLQWRPDEPLPPGGAVGLGVRGLLGGIGRLRPDHVAAVLAPDAPAAPVPQVPEPRGSGADEVAAVAHDPPAPPGIDSSVATSARMYNYWLGGHDNFAADRIAALEVSKRMPGAAASARENRKFLGRVVRFLAAEAGIRQFLDLGTGLPTKGNVHQVAQAIAPDARVVYVDNDPMVLAHARALKTGEGTAVIHADLRDVGTVLDHPQTRRLIDFTQPLAVMFVSVLHFVPDPDAHQAVARYVEAAAPGSYLVVSHASGEPDPQTAAGVTAVYAATASPATARTRDEILAFFGGLDVLEPGLVPLVDWRPDGPGPAEHEQGLAIQGALGVVGRKPA